MSAAQMSAAREEIKQPEEFAINSPQDMVQPQTKPKAVRVTANIDPEQQRREDEKLRQLAEMKRKAQEAKNNPQPKPEEPKPVVKEEPKINPSKFLEE